MAFLASINLPQDLHYIYKYVSHIGPNKFKIVCSNKYTYHL